MAIVIPVVLSGGSGTRLWPASRKANPKQLQALTGERSLLREALERVAPGAGSPFGRPVVIAAAGQEAETRRQLAGLDPEPLLILEPFARNTAACAAVAAAWAAAEAGPDALVLLAPADHHMDDPVVFRSAVAEGMEAAQDGWIVTFGIAPSAPATGLGYVRAGRPLGQVLEAAAFVEKPDLATAQRYLDDGGYYWNGGYFLFRASRMLEDFRERQPQILKACQSALDAAAREKDTIALGASAFAACPVDSIDYAIMEDAERVAVAPLRLGWSDLGAWDSVWEAVAKDAQGNAAVGDVVLLGSSGCLVRSDGPTVAVVELQDLIVVAKDGMVLVAPRARAQSVKGVVEALRAAGREDLL